MSPEKVAPAPEDAGNGGMGVGNVGAYSTAAHEASKDELIERLGDPDDATRAAAADELERRDSLAAADDERWSRRFEVGSTAYRRLSEVEARPVDWLWPQRFARGKVSMIAGDPGLGKSQITSSMAAIVTTGGWWPVDRTSCEPGNVLILSAEDDAADTIVPRLQAAGADLSRAYLLDAIREPTDDGERIRSVSLLDDIERMDETVARIGGASMVVIDPISAFLGSGRIDSHNNTDVRGIAMQLQGFAERNNVAVVAISHLSKGRQRQALVSVMGSIGWVAAARAAYGIFRDEDGDGRRRLMLPLKNNIGDDKAGFAFTIESAEVGGGIATSRISWESSPVTQSADEIYAPDEGGRSATDEAVEFLRDVLASGPMAAKDVKREAREAGITEKPLRAARGRLGIKPQKTRFDGGWEWALPEDALPSQDAHSCERAPSGVEGTLGADSGHEDALPSQDALSQEWAPSSPEGTLGRGSAPTRHLLERACEGLDLTPDQLRSGLVDEDLEDLDLGEMDPAALRHWAEKLDRGLA